MREVARRRHINLLLLLLLLLSLSSLELVVGEAACYVLTKITDTDDLLLPLVGIDKTLWMVYAGLHNEVVFDCSEV